LPLKARVIYELGNALLLINHINGAEKVFQEVWNVGREGEESKLAQSEAETNESSEDPAEVSVEETRGARDDDAEFLRYIAGLSEKEWQDRVLNTIVQQLVEIEQFEHGLLIARKIDNDNIKAAALTKIGFDMTVPPPASFEVSEKVIVRSITETLLPT
jgi:hypothetical protein